MKIVTLIMIIFFLTSLTFANFEKAFASEQISVVLDGKYFDDNLVFRYFPDDCYSTTDTLVLYGGLDGAGNPDMVSRIYLRIDLSMIPDLALIVNASINAYEGGGIARGDKRVGVHFLSDDTWDPDTLTWNNAPTTFSPTPTDVILADVEAPSIGWRSWDITKDVQLQLEDNVLSEVVKFEVEDQDVESVESYYGSEYMGGGVAGKIAWRIHIDISYSLPRILEFPALNVLISSILMALCIVTIIITLYIGKHIKMIRGPKYACACCNRTCACASDPQVIFSFKMNL